MLSIAWTLVRVTAIHPINIWFYILQQAQDGVTHHIVTLTLNDSF